MKRLIAILLLPLILCSCQESEQINEIAFAKILAIDIEDDKLILTAGIQYPKSKDGQQSKEKNVVYTECVTVSEGLSFLERKTEKKLFFGQVNCILLGEEMIRAGIVDTLDYLVRADEMRFDIPVIAVKDGTAKKVVEEGEDGELHISEKLTKLLESAYSTSYSGKIELSAINEMLEDPYGSPYMPYITFNDEKEISFDGYCVLKKDKLCAYLDKEHSLGINFLNNTANNWVFVAHIDDKKITLKLSDFKLKLKYNKGIYDIKASFITEVLQADSTVEDFNRELTDKLVSYQNDLVEKTIDKTLVQLKNLGCDVAAFGDTFHNECPRLAREYIKSWNDTFSHITYNISVTSKLDPSKNAGKPVKQGGE